MTVIDMHTLCHTKKTQTKSANNLKTTNNKYVLITSNNDSPTKLEINLVRITMKKKQKKANNEKYQRENKISLIQRD